MAVPLKFRCYRCSQLLGVARSKVGAVVSCPKCSAELVVPEPVASDADPDDSNAGAAGVATDPPPSVKSIDSGLALDFLDIRPEDIRVEPGVRGYQPPEPEPEPEEFERPLPYKHIWTQAAIADPTEPPAAGAARPRPTVIEPEAPPPPPHLDAFPIRPSVVTTPRNPSVRSRDLVLPRAVVTAWSLFVLLALMFAFLSGLLAGHYIWRVH